MPISAFTKVPLSRLPTSSVESRYSTPSAASPQFITAAAPHWKRDDRRRLTNFSNLFLRHPRKTLPTLASATSSNDNSQAPKHVLAQFNHSYFKSLSCTQRAAANKHLLEELADKRQPQKIKVMALLLELQTVRLLSSDEQRTAALATLHRLCDPDSAHADLMVQLLQRRPEIFFNLALSFLSLGQCLELILWLHARMKS